MDISCLLYACISKPKIALQTCCAPLYVPNDMITVFESNHKSLLKYKIYSYYVFDGCHHPMKAETVLVWVVERNKAKTLLHQYYERRKDPNEILTDDDYNATMKNMKKITSRTNELINMVKNWMVENSINYICALFEAEWQCAYIEQNNIVDGVMSNDGDCIVLRVGKLYFNIDFNAEKFQVYDKSLDITKVDENPLFAYESHKWPLISSLLGNNYVKRILNVGYAIIFNKKLPKLVA